jgi:fatty acid desaturase
MNLVTAKPSSGSNIRLREFKQYKFPQDIRNQIKSLMQLDNWHGLLALLEDYAVILVSAWITIHVTGFFYPVALLLIGSRQRALATLLHESAHGTLAKNKILNNILGTFCSGYLILQQMEDYKRSHCKDHHRHMGDPQLDPDTRFYYEQGLFDQSLTPREFCVKHIIQPLFLLKVPRYVEYVFKHRLLVVKGNYQERIIKLIYWSVIVGVSIGFGFWHHLILFWVIPYFTTFQVIGWFIEMSEHYPLVKDGNVDLYMSRNRFSPWYEAFFTSIHCENFHLIHHLIPSVPFWNLPKVHQILLNDPNYRRHNRLTSGIFFSSQGIPSIVSSWLHYIQVR